ncbi:hypothetical protein PTTG_26908 [Puccinia triticina 1-1 BBBD Race 1]|uniref:Uncharacterized protein n=1 Tax=Puccinia triticina (isolate 1-1 / race 1 (BBBD)) TaxID=630390 RepID=A0A180GQZ6_PUCT1|nr:hypothetical protein PTTG_26908 [Puccinia triticina 1-1 BBBD Race 1]
MPCRTPPDLIQIPSSHSLLCRPFEFQGLVETACLLVLGYGLRVNSILPPHQYCFPTMNNSRQSSARPNDNATRRPPPIVTNRVPEVGPDADPPPPYSASAVPSRPSLQATPRVRSGSVATPGARRWPPTPAFAMQSPPAPHPYWATAPIARRSSQLASRPRRDNAPPFNTGRLPPMPTRGVMPQRFCAAFLIANFSGFLTSLNLLLASFPPNHPDAVHHQTLREDARLLEAWFSSHRENLEELYAVPNPDSQPFLVYRFLLSCILRLDRIETAHTGYDPTAPAH